MSKTSKSVDGIYSITEALPLINTGRPPDKQIERSTLVKHCQHGKLGTKIGARWVITQEEIDHFRKHWPSKRTKGKSKQHEDQIIEMRKRNKTSVQMAKQLGLSQSYVLDLLSRLISEGRIERVGNRPKVKKVPHEREIVALKQQGRSAAFIAMHLGIREETCRKYIKRLYRRGTLQRKRKKGQTGNGGTTNESG